MSKLPYNKQETEANVYKLVLRKSIIPKKLCECDPHIAYNSLGVLDGLPTVGINHFV